jgi:PAS domain S-box-containing protein
MPWLALAIGLELVFAGFDFALEGVVLIGAVGLGPLVASLRLDPRRTGYASAVAVVLTAGVAISEPGMPDDLEQRVASSAVSLLGSILAVYFARLRDERERAWRRLTAQHLVARVVAEAETPDEAAPEMLRAIGETLGWSLGALWETDPDSGELHRVATWHRPDLDAAEFERQSGEATFRRGQGLPGRVWELGRPAWIPDLLADPNFSRAAGAAATGLHSAFAFPTHVGEDFFGVMEFYATDRRPVDGKLLALLDTFGTQIGQYIETKRAEQAVRISEALKSAMLETALDCVVTMDHEGRVVEFNPAAEVTFGYTRDQVLGREMAELIIPPELREQHRAGLARYLDTGEAVVFGGRLELEGMRADGSRFPVELSIQPIPGVEPPVFAGYLRDITDRRSAEEALRRSRDELDATLGNLADGVTVQDTTGSLVYANEAAAHMLGFGSPEELLAAPLSEVVERFDVFDEDSEPFALDDLPGRRALSGLEPEDVVLRFRVRATRAERWSIVKATAVRDAAGRVVRAVNIFEDITEHKRGEVGQRFLAESGRLLGASLDYATTLRSVARVAVPSFADWCSVTLVDDHGGLEQVATAHSDPAKLELAERLRERYPQDPRAETGPAHVIRTARSELLPEIRDELLVGAAQDEEHLELLRGLGIRSAMIVPLPSWRGALGALSFVNDKSGRAFDESDLALAEEVGRRAATAIENARLYGERAYIARTLQHSLLPPHLPEIPGVEVAARYRAAGEGIEVGGDFYDVFDTGDRHWAVLIGDVCGKGADAAATTALARYTLRAAAMSERRPSRVLGVLNEALLRQRDDRQFCTVAYAMIELRPYGLELVMACGGHPPPVVIRRDGSVDTTPCRGTLLGVVPDPEIQEAAIGLEPGDALVLYTDGVTEARVGGELFGVDRLETVAGGAAGHSATEIARRIEESVSAGELRDDLALLVLRVPEGPDGRASVPAAAAPSLAVDGAPLDLRLPATAGAIGSARHAVEGLAPLLDAERLDDLRLLVSELVTNGLRHGGAAGEDWIGLTLLIRHGVVRVEVSDPGPGFDAAVREREPDATGGWGLHLVDSIATRWGVDRGARTRVWFELGGERRRRRL